MRAPSLVRMRFQMWFRIKKKKNYHVGAAYFQSVELVVEVGLVCHLGLFEPLLVLRLLCSHGADLTEDPLRR